MKSIVNSTAEDRYSFTICPGAALLSHAGFSCALLDCGLYPNVATWMGYYGTNQYYRRCFVRWFNGSDKWPISVCFMNQNDSKPLGHLWIFIVLICTISTTPATAGDCRCHWNGYSYCRRHCSDCCHYNSRSAEHYSHYSRLYSSVHYCFSLSAFSHRLLLLPLLPSYSPASPPPH